MNTHNRVPWINLAVGILTIIAPYALGASDTATKWSLTITGIVIGVVAVIELAMDAQNRGVSYWPVVNIIAGIWLLISTSRAAGQTGVIWNDVVLGVTAIITAIVALGYERMTASAGANYSNRT
ncbi:MAG TPA: SPW repeat protein [Candidatus Aquilonibacter sp.]|nr:SPW repeat protein [Candidatus Aquilonibacter sp.]